jgi:thiol-disulfide isomerase/thioredoxin
MLDKVYDKYPQLNIFAINTTEFKNQNIRFDIKQIPSVLIFKDGLEIKRINGCVLTSAFMSTFNKILGA